MRTFELCPEAIDEQLEKILAGDAFVRSERRRDLLRFVVREALKGQADRIKEYVIGVEVFSRGESFDPQCDPIVRVEAGRLRRKLEEYYQTQGTEDPIIITIPNGQYAPVFQRRETRPAAWSPVQALGRFKGKAAGLMFGLLLGAGFFFFVPIVSVLVGEQGTAAAGPETINRRSLVVLPFVDLNSASGSDLADGLTQEIIEAVTHLDGINVICRTTSFQYKNRMEDVRQIGDQLQVGLVLEGSLRRIDGRVRVIAQLASATDGLHLWSRTFEQPETRLADAPGEVAQAIAAALGVELTQVLPAEPDPRREGSLKAHDEYLRGLYDIRRGGQEGLEAGRAHFKKAIGVSPDYAPPYAQLAFTDCLLASHGVDCPNEIMPLVRVAARKALDLDNGLAIAHASLGFYEASYSRDWTSAESEFQRALELAPRDPEVIEAYVLAYLMPKGRLDESLHRLESALLVDPSSVRTRELLALTYYFRREYDQVITLSRDNLGLDAFPTSAYMTLGAAFEEKTFVNEGVSAFLLGSGTWNEAMQKSFLGHAYARLGNQAKARRCIQDLKQLARTGYVPASRFALIYAGLGDKQQALEWLDKAAEERSPALSYLQIDPRYDPLRSEARFADLVKKVGLE